MEEQLLKFRITQDKLKMEIELVHLVYLFEHSPYNVNCDGKVYAKIKRDKKKEFADWFIETLQSESFNDENDTVWGHMFEEAFERLVEGYDDGDEFMRTNEGNGK